MKIYNTKYILWIKSNVEKLPIKIKKKKIQNRQHSNFIQSITLNQILLLKFIHKILNPPILQPINSQFSIFHENFTTNRTSPHF